MEKELVKYLKSKKGLNRLFTKLKDKYISLGRYSGTITINNVTHEEKIDLSNFLGKNIKENSTIKISFKEIEKKLNETKYKDFTWKNLLEEYYGEEIIPNKTKKEIISQNEEAFFNEILQNNKNNKYINEITNALKDKNIHTYLKQKYTSNPKKLEYELTKTLELIDNLPTKETNLPIFSSITGNPHFLDFNTSSSNTFFKILAKVKNIEIKNDTTDKIKALKENNITIDTTSNYVTTYHLKGNSMLDSFKNNNEILNLNLNNILAMDKIDSQNKKVYIFENPSILLAIKHLNVPVIITSGNPNQSFFLLIQKLLKNNNELYYNGDFDPEGLLIANKLNKDYNINLFCYSPKDYKSINTHTKISKSRLKKLDKIQNQKLEEIKNILTKKEYASYQENNIDNIMNFIKSNQKR